VNIINEELEHSRFQESEDDPDMRLSATHLLYGETSILLSQSYSSPEQIKQILYTQPGVTYAQISKQNSYACTNIEQEPHINQFHQRISDIQELKNMMKNLFQQMGTMLNLLTTVLNELK
jgi:hypothetical protein